MPRKARPEEAETLWHVRNEAMRHGCKICYDAEVIARWTSEKMPEHYRTSRSISRYRPAHAGAELLPKWSYGLRSSIAYLHLLT